MRAPSHRKSSICSSASQLCLTQHLDHSRQSSMACSSYSNHVRTNPSPKKDRRGDLDQVQCRFNFLINSLVEFDAIRTRDRGVSRGSPVHVKLCFHPQTMNIKVICFQKIYIYIHTYTRTLKLIVLFDVMIIGCTFLSVIPSVNLMFILLFLLLLFF